LNLADADVRLASILITRPGRCRRIGAAEAAYGDLLMPKPQPSGRPAGPVARSFVSAAYITFMIAGGFRMDAHAAAHDYPSRDVGDWTVARSEDGKGCFLSREYDRTGRTTLLLGLDADGANHLSVLNSNWSIKAKDKLKLTFRLSGGAYRGHFAVGIVSGDKQGFVTSFEARFPAYFASSKDIYIARGDLPVERLSLDGSGAAVAELRRCVDNVRSDPGSRHDKNERGDRIPKDPFAPALKREPKG
jgi:hypothetical protein